MDDKYLSYSLVSYEVNSYNTIYGETCSFEYMLLINSLNTRTYSIKLIQGTPFCMNSDSADHYTINLNLFDAISLSFYSSTNKKKYFMLPIVLVNNDTNKEITLNKILQFEIKKGKPSITIFDLIENQNLIL